MNNKTETSFEPIAEYKRDLEATKTRWEANIITLQEHPVLSQEYKTRQTELLKKAIANTEAEIVGFDNLTHPVKY